MTLAILFFKKRREMGNKPAISKPGLQKVGTAGIGGAGNQSDLRGRSVYFLHIPIQFAIYTCCCGTGKQNIFCSPDQNIDTQTIQSLFTKPSWWQILPEQDILLLQSVSIIHKIMSDYLG